MLEAMRMPPVKSGETMSSAPTSLSFSILRTSWQRATTRAAGLRCLAASVMSRFLPSSPVMANTPAACLTPARTQDVVVRCVAVQDGNRRIALAERRDRIHGLVHGDELALGGDQLVHDIGADPAHAADDVVVLHAIDGFQHLAPPQHFVKAALENEGGEFGRQVDQVRDADERDRHVEHAAARAVRQVHDLAVADAGHGDEHHVDAVDRARLALRDDPEAHCADDVDGDHDGERQAERQPGARGQALGGVVQGPAFRAPRAARGAARRAPRRCASRAAPPRSPAPQA